MEVTAILCNHAEAQNNILYLSGAGIDRYFIPSNIPAPWGVNVGIGLSIEIPWASTNQAHKLEISLTDQDGQPVLVQTNPSQRSPFKVDSTFTMGRPAELELGEPQIMNLALNFPGLPIERLGKYSFNVSVDGTEMARLKLKLMHIAPVTLPDRGEATSD